jgi:hypothetical protein
MHKDGNPVLMYLEKDNMKVLIFGSKDWTDYNDLIRQVTVLIDDRKHFFPEDKEYTFVHTGLKGAENMITEYIGKTEKFLRQKGYKIKEELIRDKSSYSDVTLIESMPDFALVFGDSARNKQCIKLLEAIGVPYRYLKS